MTATQFMLNTTVALTFAARTAMPTGTKMSNTLTQLENKIVFKFPRKDFLYACSVDG